MTTKATCPKCGSGFERIEGTTGGFCSGCAVKGLDDIFAEAGDDQAVRLRAERDLLRRLIRQFDNQSFVDTLVDWALSFRGTPVPVFCKMADDSSAPKHADVTHGYNDDEPRGPTLCGADRSSLLAIGNHYFTSTVALITCIPCLRSLVRATGKRPPDVHMFQPSYTTQPVVDFPLRVCGGGETKDTGTTGIEGVTCVRCLRILAQASSAVSCHYRQPSNMDPCCGAEGTIGPSGKLEIHDSARLEYVTCLDCLHRLAIGVKQVGPAEVVAWFNSADGAAMQRKLIRDHHIQSDIVQSVLRSLCEKLRDEVPL